MGQPKQPSGPGPDFIGVGVQKCGTTWLAARLAEHPQIYFDRKEISFFTNRFHRGYDWYHQHFDGKGDKLAGELSPNYFISPRRDAARLQHYPRWSLQSFVKQLTRPHPAARDEIAARYPGIKVFAMFRNPADRAWSHYQMWVERREKTQKARLIVPFEQMFEENGRWLQQTGRYATLLCYWREVFPDMGVFLYDDLESDPKALLGSVYRFLGVDDGFVGNIERRENARDYEPMDPAARQRVLDVYADEIGEFSKLIDRDLPWLG